MKETYSSDTLRIKPKDRAQVLNKLSNMSLEYKEKNGLIVVKLKQSVDAIPILVEEQMNLDSFEVIHGSMDDVFLNITGGELEND